MPELGHFLRACHRIADEGWNFAFLISPRIRSFCEQSFAAELVHQSFHLLDYQNFAEIFASISEFRIILLPVLTFSFSEAILALKDDDIFVQCVIQGSLRNQRVLALTTALRQKTTTKSSQPSALETEVKERFERLREIKIELTELENLSPVLSEMNRVFKQKVITEEDIHELQDGMTELRVGKETIVTPLALDRANERGIEIIRD
jgi:hypothetical protein